MQHSAFISFASRLVTLVTPAGCSVALSCYCYLYQYLLRLKWQSVHMYDYRMLHCTDGGCAGRHCRLGRVCRQQGREETASSACVCAEKADCESVGRARHHHGRGRPVCGSDGRWYSNHCHLHRTACVTDRHLRVNRRTAACIGMSTTRYFLIVIIKCCDTAAEIRQVISIQ